MTTDTDFAQVRERLDFRLSDQLYDHRPWHREPRRCRYQGSCTVCGKRTHGFDDGQDDPRGPLGDHASAPLCAVDYGYPEHYPDVPMCFLCADSEPRYRAALDEAKRRWNRRRIKEAGR